MLNKCLHCGGEPETNQDNNNILAYYGYPTYYIKCSRCGITTQFGSFEEVSAVWNRVYKGGSDK